MCSIFVAAGRHPFSRTQLQEAFDTLAHRGPDGECFVHESTLTLGSHRLAITGIDRPMEGCSGAIRVLLNGEIYNRDELGRILGVDETAETALLAAAWKRWGERFVEHLRGMYALVIAEGETIVLARDPFGKKPLYYAEGEGYLLAASEIKALWRLKAPRFDTRILPEFLFFQSPLAPHTFDPEIFQLPPGSVARYAGGRLETLHTLLPFDRRSLIDRTSGSEAVAEWLRGAVKRRIPVEVPWGALLSGGLDSSLVAAIAAESHDAPIVTFSIGYEGFDRYDERPWARIVAEHVGSEHHEVVMGKTAFFAAMEELESVLDEPLPDPAAIPLWHLLGAVRAEGIKAILTGDGSDELFGGYKIYREYLDIERARALKHKNWLRNYFRAHFSYNKEWERYKRVFEGSLLFRSSAELFTDLQSARLLRQNVRDNASLEALASYRARFESTGRFHPADWYSYCDTQTLLAELYLKKLDRVSMARGIEARSPFLDLDLARTAFALPGALRMGRTPKELLRAVAARWLPEAIVTRKKKGFSYPFIEWLSEGGELERRILALQERRGWFRPEALEFYLRPGKQRRRFKRQLFALYALARWDERRSGW
ncbi:asparagine synthase (glutamine-hydrolyzing) [Nitratifractor sp.]